jgi:hypothetical protein|tara:strand:- start:123 stop:422 length:300 start_codon:yes stop_codon:yes gene_type:complete
MLEHHRGQMAGGPASNTTEADAATHTGAGDVREMMGLPQSVCFLVRGHPTRKQTLGLGPPQVGDLRLLEDGSERGGAIGSDVVVEETVWMRGGAEMVRE